MSNDAVCCVITSDRSIDLVYSTLRAFLKIKPDLNVEYACDPHCPERVFSSEAEMVSCFADDPSLSQVFFWQDEVEFSGMLGVSFMEDGQVVYSITHAADGSTENDILKRLQTHLSSDVALISYNQYPPFSTSAEKKHMLADDRRSKTHALSVRSISNTTVSSNSSNEMTTIIQITVLTDRRPKAPRSPVVSAKGIVVVVA